LVLPKIWARRYSKAVRQDRTPDDLTESWALQKLMDAYRRLAAREPDTAQDLVHEIVHKADGVFLSGFLFFFFLVTMRMIPFIGVLSIALSVLLDIKSARTALVDLLTTLTH
jgi:hypothetical protein